MKGSDCATITDDATLMYDLGLGPTFRGCFAQPHAALLVFWLPKGFVRYAKFGRTSARCATSGIVTQGSYWMWCMSTASEHFSRLLCYSGV